MESLKNLAKKNKALFVTWGFLVFIAILDILFVFFIRYGFGSTTLTEQNKVQNSKHQISMYLVDGGATGGNTVIYLDKLYLNTFKRRV